MISMNRPSRGLCESATTMRYVGVFFRPVRRRRMRTMGVPESGFVVASRLIACREFLECTWSFSGRQTSDVGRLVHLHHPAKHSGTNFAAAALHRGDLLHHLLHLAELLEEPVDLIDGSSAAFCDSR